MKSGFYVACLFFTFTIQAVEQEINLDEALFVNIKNAADYGDPEAQFIIGLIHEVNKV